GGGRAGPGLRVSRAFHGPGQPPDVRDGAGAAPVAAVDRARGGACGAVHVADEPCRPEAPGDRPARLLRLLGHRQPAPPAGAGRELPRRAGAGLDGARGRRGVQDRRRAEPRDSDRMSPRPRAERRQNRPLREVLDDLLGHAREIARRAKEMTPAELDYAQQRLEWLTDEVWRVATGEAPPG